MTMSRGHHHLLVDLFTVEHLHTHRLILEATVGARRGDRDRFLQRRSLVELDGDGLRLTRGNRDGHGHGHESFLEDRKLDRPRAHFNPRFAATIGQVGLPSHDNLRTRYRRPARGDRADNRRLANLQRQ
jgi:hypothetical protein